MNGDDDQLLRLADEEARKPPHPNYEIVRRFAYGKPFWATVKGVRTRFATYEHFNIGKGWMCTELDGRLPRVIYAESQMTDIEAA